MYEIRNMQLEDTPIIRIRGEALAARFYPEMIPSLDREVALLREALQDSRWYARVVGERGAPKAALLAKRVANVWATRDHAAMFLWYSDLPSAGLALLRDFRRWVNVQPNIVLAGFTADWIAPISESVRLANLVDRLGFKERGFYSHYYFPKGALS